MKILITSTSLCRQPNHPQLDRLRAVAQLEFNDLGRPYTGAELARILPGVDGVVAGVDDYDAAALAAADRLQVISRFGVGTDRIDLAAADQCGIQIRRTPGANASGVAELALGLMFAVARRIPTLDEQVRGGHWPRSTGVELAGRTLGLLGAGAIGRRLGHLAQGLGMRVLAYDPFIDPDQLGGIIPAELAQVVASSDVLSLHLPLTERTHSIIDADRIAAMPADGIIINTARGGLLDEHAARDALDAQHLWGVGLDAYEVEPPTDSALVGHPRVVATPHSGSHTREAIDETARLAVENLLQVLTP